MEAAFALREPSPNLFSSKHVRATVANLAGTYRRFLHTKNPTENDRRRHPGTLCPATACSFRHDDDNLNRRGRLPVMGSRSWSAEAALDWSENRASID